MEDTPPVFWGPVGKAIAARLALPPGPWARLPRGKNVILTSGDLPLLKLIPPYWAEDAAREIAALRAIPPGGPVTTPFLRAHLDFEGWTVLVLDRLPGTSLAETWKTLPTAQRVHLAGQWGTTAAWLHSLPIVRPSALVYDWAAELDRQKDRTPRELAEAGAPAILQDTWPAFLQAIGPLPAPDAPCVMLHGDLSAGNLLIQPGDRGDQITGLIDFGDASFGEAAHDWISPGTHNFGGDPAVIRAFCDGYGWSPQARTPAWQAHLLARCLLYYSWGYLRFKFPAVQQATDWAEVAKLIWPMH
jgi:Ser/Thr protein kinase RdoA (MazF antagonist)